MATPKKIDNNAIEVIKYVSVPEGKDKGEEINRWTDEMANRTGAYESDIDISSYEEYRDTHFNLNESHSVSETWEEENTLLREYYSERPKSRDIYFSVKFFYNTKEERDKAFEYLHDDDFMNIHCAPSYTFGDNYINVIKYISVPQGKKRSELIKKLVDEISKKTGACQSDIKISSYRDYRHLCYSIFY